MIWPQHDTMRAVAALVALLLALALALPVRAQEEEEEVDVLRERLTEREDKRRPPKPYYVHVAGRPLVVGGEHEGGLAAIRRYVLGKSPRQRNRAPVSTPAGMRSRIFELRSRRPAP